MLSISQVESVVAVQAIHLKKISDGKLETSSSKSRAAGVSASGASAISPGLVTDPPDLRRHKRVHGKVRQNSSLEEGTESIPFDGTTDVDSNALVRKARYIGRLVLDNVVFTVFMVLLMSLILPAAIKALVTDKGTYFLRFFRPRGDVHMLICSIDYKRTKYPLSCTSDGEHMRRLQEACISAPYSHVLTDSRCTRANVVEQIKSIGRCCGPDDTFVFYFAGHGMSVPDANNDESDSKDEALVCYFEGCVKRDAFLVDDDLAELLTTAFNKRTHILVLADCYHSGVICNFTKPCWKGRQAISIVSTGDRPTSGGIGRGGILTNSILLATERLQQRKLYSYSVDDLYREISCVNEDVKSTCGDVRDIALNHPEGISVKTLPWPLIPKEVYVSPMSAPKQPTITETLKASSSSTDIWKAASQTEAEPEPISNESLTLCAL
jgi:hypothetical protein